MKFLTAILPLISFLFGATTDYIWCKWMDNVTNKNPFYAANWSVLIIIIGLAYTKIIIDGQWMAVITYINGAYLGTYYAVYKSRSK